VVGLGLETEGEGRTVLQSSSSAERDEASVPAARKPIPPALETARGSEGTDIKRIGAEDTRGALGVIHG
jgi:hypothetical protein